MDKIKPVRPFRWSKQSMSSQPVGQTSKQPNKQINKQPPPPKKQTKTKNKNKTTTACSFCGTNTKHVISSCWTKKKKEKKKKEALLSVHSMGQKQSMSLNPAGHIPCAWNKRTENKHNTSVHLGTKQSTSDRLVRGGRRRGRGSGQRKVSSLCGQNTAFEFIL